MNKPELLAPVGSREAFYAAISHGANAVYFSGKKFGARANLNHFTEDEIIDLIEEAHRHQVKVYITVNTIIKEEEFHEATAWVDFLVANGVDAIIVQDWGILDYIHRSYPTVAIHASTQMNTHNITQVKKLVELGVRRIIFARETSLDVIREVINTIPVETEVFVHGALCVCHSGNCYLSSLIGKRSGNRGRCAQPCRLPYELESVTENVYLLSPKDLMTLDDVKTLMEANITSFKIEGRMKRPEYVGVITKAYHHAINQEPYVDAIKDMSVMFNRGFTKGFLLKEKNSNITNTKSPNHIGVPVGKVIRYANGWIDVALIDQIARGDGLRIVGQEEDAVIVNEIMTKDAKLTLANAPMMVRLRVHKPINTGALVLKTTDAHLTEKVLKQTMPKIPLQAVLSLEDDYLVLTVTDGLHTIRERSEERTTPSTSLQFKDRIREQLQKTGQEDYVFTSIQMNIESVFLPISQINELRRQALYAIDEARIQEKSPKKVTWVAPTWIPVETHRLYFKVKTKNQLEVCLRLGVKNLLVENKEWCIFQNETTTITYIPPRITPIRCQKQLQEEESPISGVYENIANATSLHHFHMQGKAVVGLSIELSLAEIEILLTSYRKQYCSPANAMVMVYGYYELMITKHCLINKALGLTEKYCGKCHEQPYYLKDRLGFRFRLLDDGDCNLILYNSKRLHLLGSISQLKNAGVNNFLVDLTYEEDIEAIIQAYMHSFEGTHETLELVDATYGYIKEGVL